MGIFISVYRLATSLFIFVSLMLTGFIYYLLVEPITGIFFTALLILMSLIFIVSIFIYTTKRFSILGDGPPLVALFVILLTGVVSWIFLVAIGDGNLDQELVKVIPLKSTNMSLLLSKYADILFLVVSITASVLFLLRSQEVGKRIEDERL
jgi:hypothetical protein